jgi:predicted HTH transcriptional regulator
MSLIKTLLNKELDNLVYQDIIDFFINEQEESDIIEFKSYSVQYGNFNKNLEGIIRAVCAFLNSAGGIIIWGAPNGETFGNTSKLVFKGELSPVQELKDKDWIINKISDSIIPLPIGINTKILQDGSNYLYIFEIQPSNYKPHQYKNTYFARLDGQTKPAPHYLIEALFKQIKFPNIEGYLKFEKIYVYDNFYCLA